MTRSPTRQWIVVRKTQDGLHIPVSDTPHPSYRSAQFSCKVLNGMGNARWGKYIPIATDHPRSPQAEG